METPAPGFLYYAPVSAPPYDNGGTLPPGRVSPECDSACVDCNRCMCRCDDEDDE